ncbi:N2227-like protein-domain-containing protein [Armillaria novae-zelandiae]|uniref:N2227-like protein-domain-containing protein n=1 Tax=Armillaria novae-zelandiae TaxID=153914 RepID=A0AA39PMY6_9AGAR|nr:N2227-like protein-domain-containing protein [Armillaria novae-zelandiae]
MPFDILAAVFLPLVILFLVFRVYPTLAWSDILSLFSAARTDAGIFSPQHAFHSFKRYRQLSMHELSRSRAAYVTLGRKHKRIGYDIGYPAKLNALEKTIEANSKIADAIARLASVEHDLLEWPAHNISVGSGDLSRVRESLRHFVRDWSTEGAAERKKIFTPILDVLGAVAPGERAGRRVLIPGSGLGRLAWEVSQLGFDTTAVEMSSFMNFAFKFLLSPQATSSLNQHKFRAVEFPDVLPRLDGNLRLLQDDFLELPKDQKYDYIVTLFFIDTSSNIFATLEHITYAATSRRRLDQSRASPMVIRRCRQVGAKSGGAITMRQERSRPECHDAVDIQGAVLDRQKEMTMKDAQSRHMMAIAVTGIPPLLGSYPSPANHHHIHLLLSLTFSRSNMGAPDFSYYRDNTEPLVAQPTAEFPSSSHSDPQKRSFANLNPPQLDTYLVIEVVSEDEIEVNNKVRRIVGSKRVAKHRRTGQTLPLPPTPAFSFKSAVAMPQMADADDEEVQAIPAQRPVGAYSDPQVHTIALPLPSPLHQSDYHADIEMNSVN